MNEGRFIFSQVVDFVPRYEFDKCVERYDGNYRVHDLTCYNQFLHLLFGQLTSCKSIRDICMCLKAHRNNLKHLGFVTTVEHTTLTQANEKRDYHIYEDFGQYLIRLVKPMYRDAKLDDIVADKAYVDLEAMSRIHRAGSYFIMRPKDNMRFEYIEEFSQGSYNSNVITDYIVLMANKKSRQLYPDELRLVKVFDYEKNEYISFITNNFEISAEDIANIYRHRWDIEIFFKWIKQNIVIKRLWGYSKNAVNTHLWVAISAYLILARIKADYKSKYTITEIATLISVSALAKMPLADLLTNANNQSNKSKQIDKEQLTLFD